jgi:hypothetical protein
VPWFRAELTMSAEAARARLAPHPGAVFLQDEGASYLGAFPEAQSEQLDPGNGLPNADRLPIEARSWPLWIGVLPYEAFRHWERRRPQRLAAQQEDKREIPHFTHPHWQRYDALVRIEGERATVAGASRDAVERLKSALLRSAPRETPRASLRWAEAPESGGVNFTRSI